MATRNTNKPGQRWHGALEGMQGTLLYGWAVDGENPQARVTLDICLNGEAVAFVSADVARTDVGPLAAFCADPCHGFVLDLQGLATLGQGAGHITAHIANTEIRLPGSIDLAQPAPPGPGLNRVFGDGGLRLLGWAIDALDAARPCRVQAWCGSVCLASALADQDHAAMRYHGTGRHAFTLELPLTLADGQAHEIRVTDAAGNQLNGSPLTVCCYPDALDTLLAASPAATLLAGVLKPLQHAMPRSVSLQYYPQWAARFNEPAPAAQVAAVPAGSSALPESVALIITGGVAEQATLTRTCLSQQAGVTCHLFPAAANGRARKTAPAFAALLQQALDSGAGWLACVRAGDWLAPHALALALHDVAHSEAQIIYTDSETLLDGALQPWFKPAWNPEYALATDYPLQLMLIRRSAIAQALADGAQPGNAAQLAWLMLARFWREGDGAIWHAPHIGCRSLSALSAAERAERDDAARQALAQVEPASALSPLAVPPGSQSPHVCAGLALRRLQRCLPAQCPRVSLIIPTRDQPAMLAACIDSLLKWTAWPQLEIIIADNDSSQSDTHAYFHTLQQQGIRVVPTPGVFNFARINNEAVAAASGEIVGLINNDICALHAGWLDEMLSHLLQPGVGAVGAKLLWPNGMVQHGGIVLGLGHVAGHYGNLLQDFDEGDHGRNQVTQQVSGVTAACLLLRKADYLALGGMDESAFPVAFNDVDLCLRLRARGKSIVWTPFARLLHAESASRGKEDTPQKLARARREIEQLRKRWGHALLHDPFYHPCLNLDAHSQPFSGLALPPRPRLPRRASLIVKENP